MPKFAKSLLTEISEEVEQFENVPNERVKQNYNSKSIQFREFTRRITPPFHGRRTPNLLEIVSFRHLHA